MNKHHTSSICGTVVDSFWILGIYPNGTTRRNYTSSTTMKPNGWCFLKILKSFLLFLVLLDGYVYAFKSVTTRARRGGPKSDIFRLEKTNRHRGYLTNNNGITNYHCRVPSCYSKGRRNNLAPIQMRDRWDGDDVRWTTRLRRKFLRRRFRLDTSARSRTKTALVALQVLMYGYQIVTTIVTVRRNYPSYWPNHAAEMIIDSIWGSAVVNGPLTNTFGFSAAFSKAEIPYRYITSGVFHSGLLHLLVNIGVMIKQPSWLATGLGGPLYATTFFGSIIMGNIAHVLNTSDRLFNVNMYLGSSAGICGLFGLMFVCLTRMANTNPTNGGASSGQLLRGMAIMIALGLWLDNVNTAMNVGGFFGGILIGILCGPSYQKDYAMRRKNSAGYDPIYRDYRSVMGFGIMPTDSGLVSLKALYAILLAAVVAIPKYRNVPLAITKGLLNAVG